MAKGILLMGRDPDGKAKVINVDENGNVKVQLSGTIVDVLQIVNAVALTSTSRQTVMETDNFDFSQYREYDFFILSTLDQDLEVCVTSDSGYPNMVLTKDGSWVDYRLNPHVIPKNRGASASAVPLAWFPIENLVDPLPYKKMLPSDNRKVRISYKTQNAPTSGSVSIWVKGWR